MKFVETARVVKGTSTPAFPHSVDNSFPALTVVLLAAGAMERDGLFFLAGCASFAATLAYFGLLAFGGMHLIEKLRSAISGC